jgi:hypothetical protein
MKNAEVLRKEAGTHKPLVGGLPVLNVDEGNPPATTRIPKSKLPTLTPILKLPPFQY